MATTLTQRLFVEDPLHNRTTYGYDVLDRLTQTTDALGGVTQQQYTATAMWWLPWMPAAPPLTTPYDASTSWCRPPMPRGIRRASTIANGNVAASVDANQHSTSYAYDAVNRVVQTTDVLGAATQTVYDPTVTSVRRSTPGKRTRPSSTMRSIA